MAKETAPFSEGDIVALKIAPAEAKSMVVDSVDSEGKVCCLYFEGTILRQKTFSSKVLKKLPGND